MGLVRAVISVRGSKQIEKLLEGLVLLNVGELRAGRCPPLYESGARYVREPLGQEDWQTATEVFRSKHGDCEDLAAYLAASYRVRGVAARCKIIDIRPGLKHVVVELPDGSIEDPSKKLGMKGRA